MVGTTGLSRTEQAAVAAVAADCAAVWDGRNLAFAGRRIAVEVATLSQSAAYRGGAKPRFRFDKVVLQLFADLRTTLADAVPAGEAVIVTVTAPVRLGRKTAMAITDRVRAGLNSGTVSVAIHGSQVRLRRIKDVPPQMPKVIGFVHNPETAPDPLIDLIRQLVRLIAAARRRVSRSVPGSRWLVLDARKGHSHIETYRQIWGQIAMPAGFARILVVLADGSVQSLLA